MNALVRPVRIQLSRSKGWRMPPNTVKVSRPTKWGNPFRVTDERTESECAIAFRTWLSVETAHAGIPERRQWMLDHLHELRGKNLACWCRPGATCHADVLLELANAPAVAQKSPPAGGSAICPGPECPYCAGEACQKCGPGPTLCDHDNIERHELPNDAHLARKSPQAGGSGVKADQ